MVLPPLNANIPTATGSNLNVSRVYFPLSNFVTGEILTLKVVEQLSKNQYLLALKEGSLTATSELSLKVGEKFQVKVQSLKPEVILSVLNNPKQNEDTRLNERLLQWRIHPDQLLLLLNRYSELSTKLKPDELPPGISNQEIRSLFQLLNDVVFSTQTKKNPLFIRDFISKLGFSLEKNLGNMVSGLLKNNKIPDIMNNIKALSMKMATVLTDALQNTTKLNPQQAARWTNLANFANEIIQVIESRQAVNVIYQQNESGLYLQIPIALGEALRHADLFITYQDKKAKEHKAISSASILIFLNLDYLGEISIDAALKEGRIRCVIKCESEEIKQLISSCSHQLKESLTGVGYGIEKIECLKVAELQKKRREFIDQQIQGSNFMINYYV